MAKSRRVSPGDPIRIAADDWNDLLEIKERRPWERGTAGQQRRMDTSWPYYHRVRIKNFTGQPITVGSIVGLGDAVTYPTDNIYEFRRNFILRAHHPDPSFHFSRWGVVLEDADLYRVSWAAIGGIAPVLIDMGHIKHDRAHPASAELAHLESDFCGTAKILWVEGGTGLKWAWVQFHADDARELKAVLNGPIEPGGLCDASVWRSGVDTGADIYVYLDWMHGGEGISAGKQIFAKWFTDEQKWVISQAECED